jgi:hypothetical protein
MDTKLKLHNLIYIFEIRKNLFGYDYEAKFQYIGPNPFDNFLEIGQVAYLSVVPACSPR